MFSVRLPLLGLSMTCVGLVVIAYAGFRMGRYFNGTTQNTSKNYRLAPINAMPLWANSVVA